MWYRGGVPTFKRLSPEPGQNGRAEQRLLETPSFAGKVESESCSSSSGESGANPHLPPHPPPSRLSRVRRGVAVGGPRWLSAGCCSPPGTSTSLHRAGPSPPLGENCTLFRPPRKRRRMHVYALLGSLRCMVLCSEWWEAAPAQWLQQRIRFAAAGLWPP